MGFPKIQFLSVSRLNQIILGNTFHFAENFPDHLVDNIVQNVHGVSGGAVTLCLLSGLAVADIADSGRFVHGTIPQAAILPAGGKGQPCAAVTAEHIAGQQGLSLGVLGNRRTFLCTVRLILPDFLRGIKLLGRDDLQFRQNIGTAVTRTKHPGIGRIAENPTNRGWMPVLPGAGAVAKTVQVSSDPLLFLIHECSCDILISNDIVSTLA